VSNKNHDLLKAIALIWLPALGTLVFTISDIWALPAGKQIVGSIMAVDAFLGVVLGITTRLYNTAGKNFDGEFVLDQSNPAKDTYSLVMNSVDDLASKKEIRLKVGPPEGTPAAPVS
jgi:Putative phage holin Dp-1